MSVPEREADAPKAGAESLELDPRQGESRLYQLKLHVAVAVPIAALLTGLLWVLASRGNLPSEVILATGPEGGTYHGLGRAMATLLDRELPGVRVRILETSGSNDNRDRLRRGNADLGFVQNNVEGDDTLRTVARLYKEVLQIVVRRDAGISEIRDLVGKRIHLGLVNSGTHDLMLQLFAHYGIAPEEYRAFHLEYEELVSAFRRDELDAAVVVAGLTTRVVSELFAGGGVELLPLGEAGEGSALEGLCRELPGLEAMVIPAHTYGDAPGAPVGTVAVDAVLVTHREAPGHLVRLITRALFQNRFQLASSHPSALEMTEVSDARLLRFPLHAGAAGYYARNEPPFFVVYAEALSLGLTLIVSLGSGALALREWRRRVRKNRIDRYYLRVEELSAEMRGGRHSRESLLLLRERLLELRHRAFRDLVAERLEANEAFSIFQTSINGRLQDIGFVLQPPTETATKVGSNEPPVTIR